MKLRSSIALMATLMVPTIAQANNDLFNWYGSIRVQLEDSNKGNIEYKDNYSRIGAYGSKQITDGIKANYNFEFRLFTDDGRFAGNDDSKARLANVGFEGSFGSVLIGKQYSPHWNFTDNAVDIFSDIENSAGCTAASGMICHTHRYGLYAYDSAGNGHYVEYLRPDRAVTYMTPDLAGFQAAFMAVTNNGDVKSNAAGTKAEAIVGYNIAAKYKLGDITISASRYDLTSMVGDNKVDSLQVAYNREKLSMAARYQNSSDMRFYAGLPASGEIVEETVAEVYAGYKEGNMQYQVTYADISMDSPSGLTVDTDQLVLDVIYKHQSGSFYAEYSAWGDEAETVYEAADKLIVGYKFDF